MDSYYWRNRDAVLAAAKRRRLQDPVFQENQRKRAAVDRSNNPDRLWASNLRKYGLTIEQYNTLDQRQKHLCAICGKPEKDKFWRTKKIMRLAVDHCHLTGRIRGLLCHQCNTGIGKLYHSVEILQAAIDYLKLHK